MSVLRTKSISSSSEKNKNTNTGIRRTKKTAIKKKTDKIHRNKARSLAVSEKDNTLMGLQKYTIKELVRASPNIFLLVDRKGNFTFTNRLAKKLFPVVKQNYRRMSENLPEVKLSKVKDCINKNKKFEFILVRNQRTYHFFVRCLTKSKFAAFFGVEITQLAKIEADLVRSQSILRKVLDTDPNMIFVKDLNGRFVLANQAVADAYKTSIENLIGKTDADFNPNSEEIAAYLRDDREVIESGKEKIIQQESVTDTQGNTRYFSTVKRPLSLGLVSDTYVLGVSTDITSLKNLQETLHQATKMEALGQLAGGVAHDFNNLLTAIMGHAEILKISNKGDPLVAKSVEMIEVAADRAKLLTEQLLGFARKGKHHDSRFDLHVMINDTLALLKRTIEPKISISTSLLASHSYVRGDPGQIQQVIMNLCINARDALLDKKGVGAAAFEISTINPESNSKSKPVIQIIVSDNGCGMDEAVKQRVFEPFFTTKEVGRGTGLGLSTVYGVVHNHGGSIKIESQKDVGSKFFITLPVCQEKPDILITNRSAEQIRQLGAGQKVLLVDDHSDVLLVIGEMLSALGLEVEACPSGLVAIEQLERNPESFRLAIVDMIMPDIGGSETIKRIRKIKSDLPVIFISGFTNDMAAQRLISEGIPFLRKPFSIDELKNTISQALTSVSSLGRRKGFSC